MHTRSERDIVSIDKTLSFVVRNSAELISGVVQGRTIDSNSLSRLESRTAAGMLMPLAHLLIRGWRPVRDVTIFD